MRNISHINLLVTSGSRTMLISIKWTNNRNINTMLLSASLLGYCARNCIRKKTCRGNLLHYKTRRFSESRPGPNGKSNQTQLMRYIKNAIVLGNELYVYDVKNVLFLSINHFVLNNISNYQTRSILTANQRSDQRRPETKIQSWRRWQTRVTQHWQIFRSVTASGRCTVRVEA